VAVLLEYRRLGLGRKLIQACVSHGKEIGLKQLFLHAQRGTEDFYSKEGFCMGGESFFEAGIEHVAMRLNLNIKQDE
jgi:predicted GNAT family N-acyltransferase